ncbi:MAG: chitobiase/beta-hexosaminidase C-terminal domain-containing protein [Acidobacteriota bacterium]
MIHTAPSIDPYITPRPSSESPGRPPSISINGPTEVVIDVPTQGASVGYTTDEGPSPRWRIYTGPILVGAPQTIRAKAIRYGYKESAETRVTITMH